MSTEAIPGQMRTTAAEIRATLDAIEAGRRDLPEWQQPLQAITEAQNLVDLAAQLLAETVEDARAARPGRGRTRVAIDKSTGEYRVLPMDPKDVSNSRYGWGVIGHVLGVSAARAQQRFGRKNG